MWYSSRMTDADTDAAIREANAAVQHAQGVRKRHARNTDRGTPQREADLKFARDRIIEAMKPIRSEIGRSTYTSVYRELDLREASQALQAERRKLWKMQERPRKRRR